MLSIAVEGVGDVAIFDGSRALSACEFAQHDSTAPSQQAGPTWRHAEARIRGVDGETADVFLGNRGFKISTVSRHASMESCVDMSVGMNSSASMRRKEFIT
jgi:hypothetical protein